MKNFAEDDWEIDDDDFDAEKDKFLLFTLSHEIFGAAISSVIEIIEIQSIIPVPDMNEFMCGIINLRGNIIPVLDLKEKLNMGKTELHDRSCIIIIGNNELRVGLLAELVNEIVEISEDKMTATSDKNLGIDSSFISSIGQINNKTVLILNVLKFFK